MTRTVAYIFFFSLVKDVARTDRTHEYFQGDDNVHLKMLHDILMTYNMYNFDLGEFDELKKAKQKSLI